jgi:hypothetical protein
LVDEGVARWRETSVSGLADGGEGGAVQSVPDFEI